MTLASILTAITGFAAGTTTDAARTAVLDIYVPELAQLFDAMDRSPLVDRDLDLKADAFILDWAQEIAATRPLHLVIHLGNSSASAEDAATVGEAMHKFYYRRALATERRLKRMFRLGRISLLIGVLFVGVAAGIGEAVISLFSRERYATLVHESVVIGAWVALWRPMEIFLYDWWPIRAEVRLFKRLSKMDVRLHCATVDAGASP